MPAQPSPLSRADLPDEFTAETVRQLPIATLGQLSRRNNGVLSGAEQHAFDKAVHEVMRGTAERVSQRLSRADWAALRRDENGERARKGQPPSRADQQLRRLARRIGQDVDVAETLAPGVDWSFAAPDGPPAALGPAEAPAPVTALAGRVE